MPLPVIRGSLLPFLQNESYKYSPTNGLTYHNDFKGADRGLMEAMYQDWVNAGCECELTYHQGGTATLAVVDSSRAIPSDIWEVQGDAESRDIFMHPSVTAICTDDMVGIIRAGIQNIESSAPKSLSGAIDAIFSGNTAFNGLSGSQVSLLSNFVGLYLRGTTDMRRALYVLHHTSNLPNSWNGTVNISDVNVNSVYSPAEIRTEIQNAGWWFPICPDALITKMAQAEATLLEIFNNSVPTNYQMGWLKGASTASMTALNRIAITTNYTLEMWSIQPNGLYPYLT